MKANKTHGCNERPVTSTDLMTLVVASEQL